MTADFQSKYPNNKAPMLDVQVWLKKEDNDKIYYSFYEKPTKSKYVISKSSAMPASKKIECLGLIVFRRLHNTNEEEDEKEKIEIMNEFMMKLKRT